MPKIYVVYKDGRDPVIRTTLENALKVKDAFKPQTKLRIMTWDDGKYQYGTMESFEEQLRAEEERKCRAELRKVELRRQLAELEAKFPTQ